MIVTAMQIDLLVLYIKFPKLLHCHATQIAIGKFDGMGKASIIVEVGRILWDEDEEISTSCELCTILLA